METQAKQKQWGEGVGMVGFFLFLHPSKGAEMVLHTRVRAVVAAVVGKGEGQEVRADRNATVSKRKCC